MFRLIPVLLFVTGCGGASLERGPILTECQIEGLGPVTSDDKLDCDVFESDFALARIAIVAHGVLTASEVRELFANVPVFVSQFEELSEDGTLGLYSPITQNIELNRATWSLAHELLHHVDRVRLNVNPNHDGWESGPYGAAISDYRAHYRRP